MMMMMMMMIEMMMMMMMMMMMIEIIRCVYNYHKSKIFQNCLEELKQEDISTAELCLKDYI